MQAIGEGLQVDCYHNISITKMQAIVAKTSVDCGHNIKFVNSKIGLMVE
jgi:hypothetical protein